MSQSRPLRGQGLVRFGLLALGGAFLAPGGPVVAGQGNTGSGVRLPPPDEECAPVEAPSAVTTILDREVVTEGDELVGHAIVREVAFDADTIVDWHLHPGVSWVVVLGGGGTFSTAFGTYELTEGAVWSEPAYQVHKLVVGDDGMRILFVTLTRYGSDGVALGINGRCAADAPPGAAGLGSVDENLIFPSRDDAGILQLLPPLPE